MWSLLTPALATAGGEQTEELKVFFPCGKFWLEKIKNKSPQKLFLNYLAFFFFSQKAKLDFAWKSKRKRIGFEMQNLISFNTGFQSSENMEV